MVRRRWKVAAWTASLSLVVGCMNLSEHRWFERFRNRNATPCCTEAPSCCDGGLMIGDAGPLLTPPPGGPAVMETPLGTPTPVQPPPGQRLVPQPQPAAQPVPFNPNPPR
jgi:hypothetical protein